MSSNKREESTLFVYGLSTGETIEIGYEAGVSIKIFMKNGCCPILLLIFGAAILNNLAQSSATGLLMIVVIFNLVAIVAFPIFLLYMIFMYIQVKRTKYFITNQRLLEVRGKKIVKEIPKTNLRKLETGQYLKSAFAQKHAGQYSYDITVTDQISGVVICMTALDGGISDSIERWVNERR
ncbi:hypothetical protein EU527_16495 [Candidatus Thorarchaeota archaeon]|nr:MAG: hypothetical protein EU527_16495 [Candidatus Thorarchaeota archaeon]